MKILVSAYACHPRRGSEPGAGFGIVRIAASSHDVWVITREKNVTAVKEALDHEGLTARVEVVGLELSPPALRWKNRLGAPSRYAYYSMWQRKASTVANVLDSLHDFDVVHHATFASYWGPAGVASVDKPFVWGPIGGGVNSPLGLISILGFKGGFVEAARRFLRPLLARTTRAFHRTDSVVLAQNPETKNRMRTKRVGEELPNALLATLDSPFQAEVRDPNLIISVGRLLPWKGHALTLKALAYLPSHYRLEIYGTGPDLARLQRFARRSRIESRVSFRGQLPHSELLRQMRRSAVMVHPALHEDAGFVIAEALMQGLPVVSLARGGPQLLVSAFPHVPSVAVTPTLSGQTARELAKAIQALANHHEPRNEPQTAFVSFKDRLLQTYDEAVSQVG